MATPRVVGLETEYGIAAPGDPGFNPVLASSFLIAGYAGELHRTRWDFEDESPLLDQRDPAPTAVRGPIEDDIGLANVVLPNGSRLYVDHAHPEYSTPECRSLLDLVAHGIAGDRIMERAVAAASVVAPMPIAVYKNNSDGKGNSYGAHENYLVGRQVPFDDVVSHLLAFMVTRQLYTGAGKLGAEAPWLGPEHPSRFQVTQRADFFEAEVGLETTLKRPIINTRDEPHASRERYRRLHVIVGDANLHQVATLLKVGATSLALRMLEAGALPRILLGEPVADLRRVSHDPSCSLPLVLADGTRATALDLQFGYLAAAEGFVGSVGPDGDDPLVLRLWREVLEGLATDPRSQAHRLDWVTKLDLLDGYRQRHDLPWSDARLRLIDLQYHDVRRDRGLHHRTDAAGRVERLVSEARIETAITQPPVDTRAWFRGACIQRFGTAVAAASWDSVTLDPGSGALRRVPMADPLRGTRDIVGGILDAADDVPALLEALAATPPTEGVVGPAR